jgi:polysaccharide deacetylase 2 family uncharacterized protein YibQ
MKPQRNRSNRRKESGHKRPLLMLLVVILLLGSTLLLLEWLKGKEWNKKERVAGTEERYSVPDRQEYHYSEMRSYTSASTDHAVKHPRIKVRKIVPGTVAIIVDDMGASLQEVRALMDINVPMTFSLIPGLPKVREVAHAANSRGYQVMIHIPMEPHGYPDKRLEANGLLLSQGDDEIARRMDSYVKGVPYAAGANNHMGSRFTEDRQKMTVVLNQLKARSLFFVDSRTSSNSVGLSLAHTMEVEAAGRNVFLDNVQDAEAIRIQLELLADLARKKGNAVAICHPHKSTIKALASTLPGLVKEGITFVPAGELVR